ncbi:Fc.00g086640.m01.CDS01 [Cosmosporella sp. VM-42]
MSLTADSSHGNSGNATSGMRRSYALQLFVKMGLPSWIESLKERFLPDQHRYITIPAPGSKEHAPDSAEEDRGQRQRNILKMSIRGLVIFVFIVMRVALGGSQSQSPPDPGCEINGNCTNTSKKLWGQYSPYFSAPSEIDASIPDGCEVTFVNVLSRHGARYPTNTKGRVYKSVIDKIHNSTTSYGTGFEFLEDYVYNLRAEDLTAFGEREMADSGIAFYERYRNLAEQSDPFIRSAGGGRVMMSAHNWVRGLYQSQGKTGDGQIRKILRGREDTRHNNTLNHLNCPYFEEGPASNYSPKARLEWKETFTPPIVARLNEKLPGANLTADDAVSVMDLCPYHTVNTPNATLSDFCRLFSEDEWQGYDYYETLDKWYGFGPGNPLGPTQGAGYVNELIARLTGQPVNDTTNTNRTLDASPDTFPLDKTMYADFSHDNSMVTIMSVMGLYNETEQLPTRDKLPPEKTRGFSSAWAAPFAGRMYVEKMQCRGSKADDQELVRVLVNDRVMDLHSCGADRLGRCTLEAFIDSLSFARSGGLWDTCFT